MQATAKGGNITHMEDRWVYTTATDVYSFGLSLGVILLRPTPTSECFVTLKKAVLGYHMSLAGSKTRMDAVSLIAACIWGGGTDQARQALSLVVLRCISPSPCSG